MAGSELWQVIDWATIMTLVVWLSRASIRSRQDALPIFQVTRKVLGHSFVMI